MDLVLSSEFSDFSQLAELFAFCGKYTVQYASNRNLPKRRCVEVQAFASGGGFVIVAPSYTPNSAGIGCLYRLCNDLRVRGFRAFIAGAERSAPAMNAPLIDVETAKRLCSLGFSAIYPETVSGNPLGAEAVIRWVLNRPGLLGGETVYSAGETIYYYAEAFRAYIRNDVAGKLYMPTIDETIFFPNHTEIKTRSIRCFYIGKSVWQAGICDRQKTFEITRNSPSKAELGKLLRASRVLYCFDNSTILTYEALMCGCPVVIVPDGTQTREDYQRQELGAQGISWGIEEYREEEVDVAALKERYSRLKQQYEKQLTALVAGSGHVAMYDDDTIPKSCGSSAHRSESPWLLARLKGSGRRVEQRIRHLRKSFIGRMSAFAQASSWSQALRVASEQASFPSVENRSRSLECYYLGNGVWRDGICNRESTFEISSKSCKEVEDVVSLLCGARILFCFDPYSSIVDLSLKCGCPVTVVFRNGRQKRFDCG